MAANFVPLFLIFSHKIDLVIMELSFSQVDLEVIQRVIQLRWRQTLVLYWLIVMVV